MKKYKIIGWSILAILLVAVVSLLLVRFVFNKQVEAYLCNSLKNEMIDKLKHAGKYVPDTTSYNFVYLQDTIQARKIREYFKLDTIVNPAKPTWDKAISLARFVAENIPHANQKNNPKRRNAIDLWKYTRSIEPAFNCRLHSILLHELLLSEGITNRFVTCHPEDSEDCDCHVVNLVWLPELQKWAMLDSDMSAWAEDEKGTPLSLAEMRERYIDGREIVYRSLLNSKNDFVYYKAYWAKNLYWFDIWETTGYGCEDNNLAYQNNNRHIVLVPSGFKGFELPNHSVLTTDASRFWVAPPNQ